MVERVVTNIDDYIEHVFSKLADYKLKNRPNSFADVEVRFTQDSMPKKFRQYWEAAGYTVIMNKCSNCGTWDILVKW